MRRAVVFVAVIGLVLSGGAAVLAFNGGDTVTLCATSGGNVSWPGDGGTCKKNETELSVASADALATLQDEVDDLDTRVGDLEALLDGVIRTGNNLTLPGSLTTSGSVTANGAITTNGGVNAQGPVISNANVLANGDVAALGDLLTNGNVQAIGDVVADADNNGSGAVIVGVTPLNVP